MHSAQNIQKSPKNRRFFTGGAPNPQNARHRAGNSRPVPCSKLDMPFWSAARGVQMPARTSSNSRWISREGGAVSRLVTTMHRQENRKAGSSS